MSEENESINNGDNDSNTRAVSSSRPSRLTMELPLFLTMLSVSLTGVAISNIILYRTCVHSLNHSEEECKVFLSPIRNNSTQPLEKEVQKYATFVTMVRTMIESLAPAVLSLFLGVWSDRHGRKPLVVWPLLGLSISSVMTVVYCMLDGLGPWWYIISSIPMSMSGGFTALFTGAFCYLSDITSSEKRSLRMTILEASVSAGSVIGSIASSYLLRAVGNVYLLLISTSLCVIGYLFTNVFLSESLPNATPGGLKSLLDLSLVKEMMVKCFKKRPNYGRAVILFLTVANSLSIFILYGLLSLDYMYCRQKLHWAIKQYSTFSAVHTTTSFFGSFFGVILVQKYLRVSDLVFAIIAFASQSIEYIIKAFATVSWHMYLAAGVTIFRGLSAPLIRSYLSKTLPPEDIAKVFALMCAIEGVSPLISPVLYSSLYAYTLSAFPGAIFILSAGITTSCAVFSGIAQYLRWRSPPIEYEAVNVTNES
ncbi:proton-coupled folate transporter-like [Aricia agestis]|uniref:proton-coupled folate transporter-like n=1 Tax=Aricia agestis TaxID=91739 RepID=UPI001C203793|nr:proton-coupled folate transporter-like [Aricia agestis]